jgi:fused signal recognition particle receptor
VIIGICDELKIPVRYVGIGEKVADLKEFNPHEFVDALFGD